MNLFSYFVVLFISNIWIAFASNINEVSLNVDKVLLNKLKTLMKNDLKTKFDNKYDIPDAVYDKTITDLINLGHFNTNLDIIYYFTESYKNSQQNNKHKRQYLVPYTWWSDKTTCELACDAISYAAILGAGINPYALILATGGAFLELDKCYNDC